MLSTDGVVGKHHLCGCLAPSVLKAKLSAKCCLRERTIFGVYREMVYKSQFV